MHTPRLWTILALTLNVLFAPNSNAEDVQPTKGIKVGNRVPIHAADFVNGTRKGKAACPSVLINNLGGRGVLVWNRGKAGPAIELAKALDAEAMEDDKVQRFLIALDVEINELTESAEPLKRVVVGRSREASRKVIDEYVESEVVITVFLIDRRVIKQTWQFKTDELDEAKIREICAATKTLAASSDK